MKWSDSARQLLEKHINGRTVELKAIGADPAEVGDDLRLHISEEVRSKGKDVVTAEDVASVIGFSGDLPEPEILDDKIEKPKHRKEKETFGKIFFRGSSLFFGVLVPFAAFFLEAFGRVCSQTLFNPMPTFVHVIGVLSVILFTLYSWIKVRRVDEAKDYKNYLRLNAFVCGLSLYFMLQFIHVVPFAIPGILFLLGLLPLSPYFTFIVNLKFRSSFHTKFKKRFATFLFIGFFTFFLTDIPRIVTHVTLTSINGSSDLSMEKVKTIRTFGSVTILENLCEDVPFMEYGSIYRIFANYRVRNKHLARKLYYLVTGEEFKISSEETGRHRRIFDFGQGADEVGQYLPDLKLFSSRFDSSIDADGGVVYTEWTMEFQNDNLHRQREARSRILLPEGGVVSRLTLWINGEEREAAFAKKGQVVNAYKSVVRRRMDPVLVTKSGDNQVRMQCFPVPPSGGKMKLRIGITCPLQLSTRSDGSFCLPIFSDRNFMINDDLEHHVWLEAQSAITFGDSTSGRKMNGRARLIKDVKEAKLRADNSITVERDFEVSESYHMVSEGFGASQKIKESYIERPVVAVVIDGSKALDDFKSKLAKALKSLDKPVKRIYIAGSEMDYFSTEGIHKVYQHDFDGGCDNLPALKKAWKFANQNGGSVLWIHGVQPVEISPVSSFKQILVRDNEKTPFYDFPIVHGKNLISEEIGTVSNYDLVTGDLELTLKELTGNLEFFSWEMRTRGANSRQTGKQTSKHLYRLWAAKRVEELVEEKDVETAVAIAVRNQIVTSVTGAVVLENQSQYDQHGLKPVDSDTVPTIPEPEAWLMLVIALLFFYSFVFRQKTQKLCRN